MIACVGSSRDRSGLDGLTQEKLDLFFVEATAFSAWWQASESDAASVMPLGEATPRAAEAFLAVKAKVGDYFARCRLVAFDARAAGPLNREEADFAALAPQVLRAGAEEVSAFPLARSAAGKALPLDAGVNPAWAEAITRLRNEVVKPLLGERTALTEDEWSAISAKLAPFRNVERLQGRIAGGAARPRAGARDPRERRQGAHRRSHRQGPRARGRVELDPRRRQARPLPPAPARAADQLRLVPGLLQPPEGRVPRRGRSTSTRGAATSASRSPPSRRTPRSRSTAGRTSPTAT